MHQPSSSAAHVDGHPDLTGALWASAQQCLQEQAWEQAEGLLWRLWQVHQSPPWELSDALGYCLLMQGSYRLCEAVLRPAVEQAGCSFWVSHKLGDALRGQSRLAEAAGWYELAAQDGSDSPLTARNLLQVLYPLDLQRCLNTLERWHRQSTTPASFWEGAREAARLVPGLELAHWLCRYNRGDAACRQRLLEACCLALDLEGCWRILAGCHAPTAWESALAQRLLQLGLGQQLQPQTLAHNRADAPR